MDIGYPGSNLGVNEADMQQLPLTWWWLRRIGFRLITTQSDNQPHMLAPVNQRMDTSLEVSPSNNRDGWMVWLRSDIAHSRCRFVFVRNVSKVSELVELMEAIGGERVTEVEFNEKHFQESLDREAEDCKRRYLEMVDDARWGRVPGGL